MLITIDYFGEEDVEIEKENNQAKEEAKQEETLIKNNILQKQVININGEIVSI